MPIDGENTTAAQSFYFTNLNISYCMFTVVPFMLCFHSRSWKIFDGSRKSFFLIIKEGGEI